MYSLHAFGHKSVNLPPKCFVTSVELLPGMETMRRFLTWCVHDLCGWQHFVITLFYLLRGIKLIRAESLNCITADDMLDVQSIYMK